MGFSAELVSVMVSGHSDDLLPAQLELYRIQRSRLTKGHHVITLKLHVPSVAFSYIEGSTKHADCQVGISDISSRQDLLFVTIYT